MSDVTPRLTEEQRARIHAARARGKLCAGCGRDLVDGEHVWIERFTTGGGGRGFWQAPVGAECASPETVRATCRTGPEVCAGCGRGVFG